MQSTPKVSLRKVTSADLPILFEHNRDPQSVKMAAFTVEDPADRAHFEARWAKVLASHDYPVRGIWQGDVLVGVTMGFEFMGEPNITYWIDRQYWGQGIATQALTLLLELMPPGPVFGRAASDNLGSIRVMQKCGFEVVGKERAYAAGRGAEIEEMILKWERPGGEG